MLCCGVESGEMKCFSKFKLKGAIKKHEDINFSINQMCVFFHRPGDPQNMRIRGAKYQPKTAKINSRYLILKY